MMASLNMLFPGGKAKAVTLSYDDGVQQDWKLMDILNKHGLKATFNLNSGCYAPEGTTYPEGTIYRRMSKSEAERAFINSGHEVAAHGYSHPWLEQLPDGLAAFEVVEDRKNLEQQFHTLVRGMAYPFGTYKNETVEILKNAGIEYCRTVHSSHDFNIPTDWLRLPATCHHADPQLMDLAHRFVEGKPNWNPFLFYLWGHSYEFDEKNNWDVIEEFAEYVGGRDDVWYATNIEVYDYVEAYRSLKFTYDLSRVKNMSAITVWFTLCGKVYQIQPGETISFE